MRPVLARAEVGIPRDVLYAQLADLRAHWRIAGRWIEPLSLEDDGGVVRLRGPFGIGRVVRTTLRERTPGRRLAGTASTRGTQAEISWTLEDGPGATSIVTLRAEILRASPFDRLLLDAGGRRWLTGRFAATLRSLA